MKRAGLFISGILMAAQVYAAVNGVYDDPEEIRRLHPREAIGAKAFTQSRIQVWPGTQKTLESVFSETKLSIVIPLYFSCRHVCPHTLANVATFLKENSGMLKKWGVAIVLVDISYSETNDTIKTALKKHGLLASVKAGELIVVKGSAAELRPFFDSMGLLFDYHSDVISHVPVQVFVTPDGEIKRYLYGSFGSSPDIFCALAESWDATKKPFLLKVVHFFTWYDSEARLYRIKMWRLVLPLLILPMVVLALSFLRRLDKKAALGR